MSGAGRGDPAWPGPVRRRPARAGYNPVVTADGARWRDYELAAEAPGDERRPPRPLVTHDAPSPPWQGPSAPARHQVPAAGRHALTSPARPGAGPSQWYEGGPGRAAPGPARDDGLPQWPEPVLDWFDAPGRPPRLDTSRPYGTPGGLAWPDPQVQRDLCQTVPEGARFPDPRGTWIRLVNGEGPAQDPFRATNALDCALAVISTWHGEPMVAAPRQPQYDRMGRPVLSGEAGGVARAERWLGHRFEYIGQGRRAYSMIARRLETAGHGAAAVLVTRWPSGGAHAWNAVNSAGEVVWVDAQRGRTSVDPPQGPVTGVFCVVIDRRGRRR